MASIASEQPVCCPRCGYDQAGVFATWRRACPLEGTCSECGLRFAWGEVLNPDRQRVAGFVEHSVGRLGTLTAAWRTLAWTPVPLLFWTRVRLEHHRVPRRWWVYLLMVLAPIAVVRRLTAIGLFAYWNLMVGWPDSYIPPVPWSTVEAHEQGMEGFIVSELSGGVLSHETWHSDRTTVDWGHLMPPAVWGLAAVCAAMPLMLMVLPQTRARLRILPSHAARAAVFGTLPVCLVIVVSELRRTAEMIVAAFDGPVVLPFMPFVRYGPPEKLLTETFRFCAEHQMELSVLGVAWIVCWWGVALAVGFRTREWPQILTAQTCAAIPAAMLFTLLHPHALHLIMRWM